MGEGKKIITKRSLLGTDTVKGLGKWGSDCGKGVIARRGGSERRKRKRGRAGKGTDCPSGGRTEEKGTPPKKQPIKHLLFLLVFYLGNFFVGCCGGVFVGLSPEKNLQKAAPVTNTARKAQWISRARRNPLSARTQEKRTRRQKPPGRKQANKPSVLPKLAEKQAAKKAKGFCVLKKRAPATLKGNAAGGEQKKKPASTEAEKQNNDPVSGEGQSVRKHGRQIYRSLPLGRKGRERAIKETNQARTPGFTTEGGWKKLLCRQRKPGKSFRKVSLEKPRRGRG